MGNISVSNKFNKNNDYNLICSDAFKVFSEIPDNFADHCITDPPYNISGYDFKKEIGWLKSNKYWKENKNFNKIEEDWDKFSNGDYDQFTKLWLDQIFRILKPNGNIIIFGSYHNIYKIGHYLQQNNRKIINSIVWYKRNAFPNITQRMLCESTEHVIWAVNEIEKKAKNWIFNYEELKKYNTLKECTGCKRVFSPEYNYCPHCGGNIFKTKKLQLRSTGTPRLVPSQEWWEDTCLRACGALRTNIDDLFSYLEVYRTGGRIGRERVVSPASLKKMLRPAIPIQPGLYYGYGVAVRPDYHGNLLAFHSGGLKGVSSEFAVVPKKGVAGAVLANVESVPSPMVLEAGINQQLGLPMLTPFSDPPPASEPPRSLREYAGWYCSGEGIWTEVTAQPDHLRFDFRGIEMTMTGLKLRPNGNDTFLLRSRGQTGSVRFERDSHGRIWAAFLGWRFVRRRAPRELPLAARGRMVW